MQSIENHEKDIPSSHDEEATRSNDAENLSRRPDLTCQTRSSTGARDSRSTTSMNVFSSIKRKSSSRDSSILDDPKSLVDSISASSGRNWSNKETVEYDPSISSIKGDSVSATIADYNMKHRVQTSDNQSRTSARLCQEFSPTTDDLSSNINFCAIGGSTSGTGVAIHEEPLKPSDFVGVSSHSNADAFDVIEESSIVSSCDEINPAPSNKQNQRRPTQPKRRILDFDDDLPTQESTLYQIEPIVLRGNGNLTIFGLSNSYPADFPSALIGRVSKEEFDLTMRRINTILSSQQSLSAKLLLLGGLFCCCSLGLSLVWPSIVLRKRSKASIEKVLASENNRLYSKLGLNWKLAEQRCYSNHAFVEFVILIEFAPKINLYAPD